MASTPRLGDSAGLVEILVTTADAPARDRILLDAVQASGLAASTALWRPIGVRGSAPVWTRLLSRGSLERSPSRPDIEAVERGESGAEVAPGRWVLLAGKGEGRVAMVLCGSKAGPDELDRLEALLTILAVLDPPQPTTWLQRMPSLLPRRGTDPRGLGRALLEHLTSRDGAVEASSRHEASAAASASRPLAAGSEPVPAPCEDEGFGPPLPAVRRSLAGARPWLAERGLGVRLVVRGRLDAPTRVPQRVLEELVTELLRAVRSEGADPIPGRRILRVGLRDEPSAWHLRIAGVPADPGAAPGITFGRLELPIGAPRPAEHVLVRFLAAGGVLRSQGSDFGAAGWFLRLPKPQGGRLLDPL